jgi:hypothetical protein
MNLSQIRDLNALDPIETELGNGRIGGFGELWDACKDKVPLEQFERGDHPPDGTVRTSGLRPADFDVSILTGPDKEELERVKNEYFRLLMEAITVRELPVIDWPAKCTNAELWAIYARK